MYGQLHAACCTCARSETNQARSNHRELSIQNCTDYWFISTYIFVVMGVHVMIVLTINIMQVVREVAKSHTRELQIYSASKELIRKITSFVMFLVLFFLKDDRRVKS